MNRHPRTPGVPESLPIHTIGHSTRAIPEFVELLRVGQVGLVVDVRSVPTESLEGQAPLAIGGEIGQNIGQWIAQPQGR
jgi:hypothetical protein